MHILIEIYKGNEKLTERIDLPGSLNNLTPWAFYMAIKGFIRDISKA